MHYTEAEVLAYPGLPSHTIGSDATDADNGAGTPPSAHINARPAAEDDRMSREVIVVAIDPSVTTVQVRSGLGGKTEDGAAARASADVGPSTRSGLTGTATMRTYQGPAFP